MDPAGLLISIATIAYTLDELSESYSNASSTLALIKAQIKILESGTQRIQDWMQFTDAMSKGQVMRSLSDAVATVNSSLERLQHDIEGITHTGPRTQKMLGRTASDQWVKTKFVYSEGRMRKHLADVRECTSLVSFALNVCQLPVGQTAEQEVKELSMGARTLHRAQTSARRDRRTIIQESGSNGAIQYSEDYSHFMTSVMDAEAELPEESPAPTRQPTDESHASSNEPDYFPKGVEEHTNRDELHLPDQPSFDLTPGETDLIPTPLFGRTVAEKPQTYVPTVSTSALTNTNGVYKPTAAGASTVLLDESSRRPVTMPKARAVSSPSIPPKEAGEEEFISEVRPPAGRPAVRRKPVSRASVPSLFSRPPQSSPAEKQLAASPETSATTSPATSATSVTEKMTPLTQSILSLGSTDYLNVELDHPPVSPYPDNPPAYAAASPIVPRTQRATQRRDTNRSSILHQCPAVVQLAIENRLDELSIFVREGGNVNEPDPRTGRTALMEGARYHRLEVCRFLLNAGARVHLKDVDGNSALHLSGREGDSDICQILLDGGAHAEDGNKDGTLPLQLAVAGGHTEAVMCLINATPFRKPNDTALVNAFLTAVKLGDIPTAQALLLKGIKMKKLKESWRLAANAAQSGSLPMLELLLNEGASVKERSPLGWTPLHHAAHHGHQAMIERLLALKVSWKSQTKKTEETALHMAAAAGHTAAALTLMSHKDANVTMRDADNQEPIHHAVRRGDIKLFTRLVEDGAKLKEANKYGWKPIHLAAAYGHVALLAECMTRGSSIEEKLATPSFKPEKRTNQAARRGYWPEVRWPHSGSRPLHLALEFGHDDVANMLVSGGAKIDESDSRGWRPLHTAAWSCRPDMVELLLQKGANPDTKTVDGHSALSLGFREHGLTADMVSRGRIYDMLSMALARAKKSKLGQLKKMMSSGPSESKTAYQRNLAWHTAQLAESLYQSDTGGEGEVDDLSLDDSDIGVAVTDDQSTITGRSMHVPGRAQFDGVENGYDGQQDLYDAQPGSSRSAKG